MKSGNRFTKRCRRYNIAGHAHELTFCCYQNRAFLAKERTCQYLVDAIIAAKKKVDELLSNQADLKDNIILWADLAKANPAAASSYINLINDAEVEVSKLESRIKLLTIQSPDLQANPEEIPEKVPD